MKILEYFLQEIVINTKINFPLFLFHALLFKKVLYAIDARFCYGAKDWYA